MILHTRQTAKGILHTERGIMLVQNKRGFLNLPGGGIDPQESPWRAFVRELHEETGLSESDTREARQVGRVYGLVTPRDEPLHIAEWRVFSARLLLDGRQLDQLRGHDEVEAIAMHPAEEALNLPNLRPLAHKAIRRSLA